MRRSTRCASCSRTRRRSPWGRPGSTTSATTRRATRSATLFARAGRARRASSASRSSSTRARPTTTRSPCSRGFEAPVVLHCFSSPELLDAGARARLVRLVRRQRHLPEGGRAALGGRSACRPTGCSPRPTARTSSPQPRARPAERARERRPHARGARRGARRRRRPSSRRRSRRTRPARSACRDDRHAEEAARPALPRRREHPRRDRPPRRARPDDVVLEIGAGARRAHALPRRPRRARPRGRARPLARAAAARARRSVRTSIC